MKVFVSFAICVSLAFGADSANLTGSWKLNVKKSTFDKNAAPLDVVLKVQHNEPALQYAGSVTASPESQPDTFEFNGAIDEKIYPVKESPDTGRTVKFKRKSQNEIESWSSDRNNMEEHAVTTLSGDGKSMTRTLHVKLKDGTRRTWTEVYDKQK